MRSINNNETASVKMQHEPAAEADSPEVEGRHCIFTRAVSESPVWPHVSNHIFLYKFIRIQLHSTAVNTTILT